MPQNIDFATLAGNYSTEEVDTGFTWLDGRKIYKKTVNFTSLPNSVAAFYPHGITNFLQLVRLEGVAYRASDGIFFWLPSPHNPRTVTGTAINVVVDKDTIDIAAGTDRSDLTAHITLWYTKTG